MAGKTTEWYQVCDEKLVLADWSEIKLSANNATERTIIFYWGYRGYFIFLRRSNKKASNEPGSFIKSDWIKSKTEFPKI